MDDVTLTQRLRAHFDRQAQAHRAPDFESMMAAAAPHKRRTPLWIGAGLAAAVVAAVLVVRTDAPPAIEDSQLLAQLTASVAWTAPSDVLLIGMDDPVYLGLPRFNDMRYRMQEVTP